MASPNEKQIDDIVNMLDEFMASNGGHMNITVDPDGKVRADGTRAKSVTTMKSLDCAAGNLACHVPTLFEGLDGGDDDPEESEIDHEDMV